VTLNHKTSYPSHGTTLLASRFQEELQKWRELLGARSHACCDDLPLSLPPLRVDPLPWDFHFLAKTDSTNAQLLPFAKEASVKNRFLVASEQSAGRGRQERRWIAPAGEGLLFSFLLHLDLHEERPGLVGHLSALAMILALRQTCAPDPPAIYWKWPNDLFAVEPSASVMKLAGLLVQSTVQGKKMSCVVGLGLNVHQEEFGDDLHQPATSLARLGFQQVDKTSLCAVFCAYFESLRHLLKDPSRLIQALAPFDLLASSDLYIEDSAPQKSTGSVDSHAGHAFSRESEKGTGDARPAMPKWLPLRFLAHLNDGRLQLECAGERLTLAAGEIQLLRAKGKALYFRLLQTRGQI
jgi:biotin-[acetyl-CoA-carboxylase] ligase BirA-like protein